MTAVLHPAARVLNAVLISGPTDRTALLLSIRDAIRLIEAGEADQSQPSDPLGLSGAATDGIPPASAAARGDDAAATFQARVAPWMDECFGPEISADREERNDRFIEEALELTQASGYTAERAHALVDYVFGRPPGEIAQEVGGVMVTLAAHCLAHGVDMHEAGETDLARVWTKVEQIREKQRTKPKGSALPVPQPPVI